MTEHFSRRKFLKVGLASTIGVSLTGAGGYLYARDIEPESVEVVKLELTLPHLDPAFDGYKLAQISDIHIGTGMTSARLMRFVEQINAQQPDAVALTGDFVTDGPVAAFASDLIAPLSQLKPNDVSVAVLGNHDHWTSPEEVRAVLRESSIVDVSNKVYTVQRSSVALHLAGVDDYWERQDRLEQMLTLLPETGAAILLAHEPDYADFSAPTGRFDLQISGHSHGGQFIIPILHRPFRTPRYSRKYPLGKYQVGAMIQYTNRGLGTILPALRLNCPPEITIFTLRAPGAQA